MSKRSKTKAQSLQKYGLSAVLELFTRYPIAVILVVGILVSLPLIWSGLPTTSDDTVWHVIYFDNFVTQLFSGEIYPRWAYLTNGGLGGPTYFFYQPMSYYIAAIFRILPISSIHQLGLASSLGIILSGVTSFLWLREISSARAALVGSLFYLLLPYPVAQDVYVRAAFGEAFTFVWMPLAMLAVVRISRGSFKAIVGLAFSYGMLCMTHLPITVIFSPLLVFYIAVFSEKTKLLRNLLMTFAGVALGAGMAAAYIIPAVAYQNSVYLNEMKEGSFFFGNWLMTRDLAIYGSMRYFQLTMVVVSTALFSAVVGSLDSDGKKRERLIFWSMIVLACVFMTLYISYPIWSNITIIQSLQFPWRFNAIASLAVVALITTAVSSIEHRSSAKAMLLGIFLVLMGGYCAYDFSKVVTEAITKPREQWKKDYDAHLYRLQEEVHGRWPKAVAPSVFDLDKALATIPSVDGRPAKAFFESGQGIAEVIRWASRNIEVNVESPTSDTLNISQFSFPGWTAKDLDTGEAIKTELSGDLGLVSVKLPAGKHRVAFKLEMLWPEIIADTLSVLSLVLSIVLFICFRNYREAGIGDLILE